MHSHLHFSFFRIAPLHSHLHLRLRFSRIFNFMEICKCKCKFNANANAIFKWPHPWYTYTPQYARDNLERHQSLCLRIVYPNIDSYQQRMNKARILPINEVLHRICTKYADKIVSSQQNHRLAIFVPPKQSSLGRHSERLADRRQFSARTALGSKSLFQSLAKWYFSFYLNLVFLLLWLTKDIFWIIFSVDVNMVSLVSSDTLISTIKYII